MATTTITVAEVRPQQPGKKTCVVVDSNGDFYYVWPNHAGAYQPGYAYDIAYNVRSFKGQNFRYVDNEPRPSNAAPQQPTQRAPAGRSGSANGTTSGSGYNTYRETSAADKLSMFVTAIVKAGVQSGQVQFNDEAIAQAIMDAVNGYRAGWTAAHQQTQRPAPAPVQQPQQRTYDQDDPGDTIPF